MECGSQSCGGRYPPPAAISRYLIALRNITSTQARVVRFTTYLGISVGENRAILADLKTALGPGGVK